MAETVNSTKKPYSKVWQSQHYYIVLNYVKQPKKPAKFWRTPNKRKVKQVLNYKICYEVSQLHHNL